MTGLPQSASAVVGPRYRSLDVPVRGGLMRVGVWEPEPTGDQDPPTVLAIHGITSSHLAWPVLAAALPGVRVVAPDLRGRGRSRDLPAPYGMPAHADDCAAVLEHLGLGQVMVVGHSMGGFVAVVLADRHPSLVASLVLVDGGMPLLPPPGVAPDQLAEAVLGPAADRLEMTFADQAAYRAFWAQHPAFAADWGEVVTAYLDYDLVPDGDRLRPATRVEALHEDIRELVDGDSVLRGLESLPDDVAWVLAPRGLMDEVPPLYPDAARAHWLGQHPGLRMASVPDVNHYTIVMTGRGIAGVLAALPGR